MMTNVELTIIIGQYAMAWHLPEAQKESFTTTANRVTTYLRYLKFLTPLEKLDKHE